MGKTMILPARIRYQGEVATAVNATKSIAQIREHNSSC